MSALRVKLWDGLTIAVPDSLSAITTYVLLEQEEWFEKEIILMRRFLKPEMTAIDVGANLGVYSLPMARLVGPGGRVFCYEPGREARTFLEHSRALNGLINLEIIGSALSDSERQGRLAFAASTELRALDSAGAGEPVHITSLDKECAVHQWRSVDFIKIDAEGEEERIIAGGHAFFQIYSPLVMFEIKAGSKVNESLRTLFPAVGYRVFRQLAGAPILVPADAPQPLDDYELNLFAAKPDRVRVLSQEGLLVDAIPGWVPARDEWKSAISFWQCQKFAHMSKVAEGNGLSTDSDYQNSLAAYAKWRALDQPAAPRCAALASALRSVRAVCARAFTAERASTWARVAWEWGARGESVAVLQRLLTLKSARIGLREWEPFWPANPRFDTVTAGDQPIEWFVAAAAEQFERTARFSSVFGGGSPYLSWLCSRKFASAEMERRRTLIAALAGLRPRVPERLCAAAPDHLNAEIWAAGMVPGTVL